MAARKRKPLTDEQKRLKRSKAAKKGWRTRRKNVVIKKVRKNKQLLTNAQKGFRPEKRRTIPELDIKGKTKKQLEKMVRDLHAQIVIDTFTDGWVDAMPPEFLRPDGEIALQPTMLRHHSQAGEIWKSLEFAFNEGGEPGLDTEARRLSSLLEVPLKEVYTIWYSP